MRQHGIESQRQRLRGIVANEAGKHHGAKANNMIYGGVYETVAEAQTAGQHFYDASKIDIVYIEKSKTYLPWGGWGRII